MKIAISEIEGKLTKNTSIKERLKQAMRLAMDHWLVTAEQEQFRCAVGAVMLTTSEEERMLLSEEMRSLSAISAATQGIPVDFEAALAGNHPEKWYHLMPLWKELKAVKRKP